MRLRYTLPALNDLDATLDFIANRSPQGAKHVQARIQTVINLLLTHPHIGIQTDDQLIRRINTTPYYLIFYEALEDEIIIHAVRHAARDPSKMPGSTQVNMGSDPRFMDACGRRPRWRNAPG